MHMYLFTTKVKRKLLKKKINVLVDVFEQGLYRNDWHVNKSSDWLLSLIDSVGEDLVENKMLFSVVV